MKINLTHILLTGGSGYLGLRVADFFQKKGFKVTMILRSEKSRPDHFNSNIDTIYLDDPYFDVKVSLLRIDHFINSAVDYGRGLNSESDCIWTNIFLPVRILNIIKETNFTFITFDSFYSKFPLECSIHMPGYVLSKRQLIEWLEVYNKKKSIKIIVMYLEHLIGPNESITKFNGWFIEQCKLGTKEIQLTHGKQIRDFVFVDDVISAIDLILLSSDKLNNKINKFEVGSGKGNTLRMFCELVHHKLRSTAKINFGIVPTKENEILESIAKNQDLMKLGWTPTTDLEVIVENVIRKQEEL